MARINTYKKRIDFFLSLLKRMGEQVSDKLFLSIGCGSGLEALCLKQEVQGSLVVGVDVDRNAFEKQVENKLDLVVCDCSSLPFIDNMFDFCYCYHVLEHVVDHQKCIEETKRILKSDGSLFLATPNRRRLIGYISSAKKTSLYEVIRWNFSEWLARLRGIFVPGKVHCGFCEEERQVLLDTCYPWVVPVTTEYEVFLSRNSFFEPLVKLCLTIGILRPLSVSHVFYCRRTPLSSRRNEK